MSNSKTMIDSKGQREYVVYTKDGQMFTTKGDDMTFFNGVIFFGDLKISQDCFAYAAPCTPITFEDEVENE